MDKTALLQKRKTLIDLIVICVITLIVLGILIAIQDTVENFARDTGVHILLRTAVMPLMLFCTAGLGIMLVMLIREESFISYGLRKANMLKSLVFCTLAFVPNIIFGLAAGQIDSYLPFQNVWMTSELRSGNFAIGAAVI